ncbi:hypothetical protein [Streptomyces sp. 2112.2]|uniref:hypothetical protein n=1 Tax=Streptomyces sp. 2112.2 TaxID=1881024 RepID=UPI00115FAC84|nr:hypothetical protein [Streptomyces sp. 2112.2]
MDTEGLAEVQAKAQELLAGRLEVIDELTGADQIEKNAEAAVQRARTAKATVWQKALRAGWSEEELGKLGFKKPTVKAPGRPRGKKANGQSSQRPRSEDSAPAKTIPEQPGESERPAGVGSH